MSVSDMFVQFCSGTSLRGAAKLVKAPTRLLQVLWGVYLCLMAAAFIACVCLISADYLQYKTVIQTTIKLNDHRVAIPAITICNHYAFSETAKILWSTGDVVSPTNFSRQLRRSAFELFNASEFAQSENVLASDTKQVYYQSIDYADAVNVSFAVSQMFVLCVTGFGAFFEVSDWRDCNLVLKRVSLPAYFNCYQVQAPKDIDWMTLVLRVSSSVPSTFEEAFIQDIFEQADGIRLEVHENDTYPAPTLKGIHVEPGKLVEISYQPVRWAEADSPRDACMPAAEAGRRRIRDLDQEFAYSYDACLGQELGRIALEHCGCHFVKYLRGDVPNATHPYCADTRQGTQRMLANMNCLHRLNLEARREQLSAGQCAMPCELHYFDTVASMTVWRATEWQLHWLMRHSRCFRVLDEATHRLAQPDLSTAERQELAALLSVAAGEMRRYFESENLTLEVRGAGGNSTAGAWDLRQLDEMMPQLGSNFAYVTLRRQSRNIVQKSETLSLGFSALMSQVGGLSSLFLGLTCAFVVELVELCLLMRHRRSQEMKLMQQQLHLPQQSPTV